MKKQQCKLNHGILPFWADITESKAKEIGFEILDTRFVDYTEGDENGK